MHTDSAAVVLPIAEDARNSRVAMLIIWVFVAVLAAVVTLTSVLTNNSATTSVPVYPSGQLDNPIAPWGLEILQPAIWVVALILIVIQAVRKRTFSVPALFFLSATMMFW